jgi:hypothetical protein
MSVCSVVCCDADPLSQAKAREEAAKKEQQQQQQQQQQPPAAAPPAAGDSSSVSTDPHLKSTAAAVEYEQLLQRKLSEAEAAAAEITSRPELKQQRRALEKQITMAVSQISGTQQQVGLSTRPALLRAFLRMSNGIDSASGIRRFCACLVWCALQRQSKHHCYLQPCACLQHMLHKSQQLVAGAHGCNPWTLE